MVRVLGKFTQLLQLWKSAETEDDAADQKTAAKILEFLQPSLLLLNVCKKCCGLVQTAKKPAETAPCGSPVLFLHRIFHNLPSVHKILLQPPPQGLGRVRLDLA